MNAFIIGAGFTKAVFDHAPLNGELLDVLTQTSTKSVAAVLRDRYKTSDIEIALTRLDLDIARYQRNGEKSFADLKLRRQVETELGKYFRSLVASEELLARSPWLDQFIGSIFASGDVAISLNYDCVLEGALDCRRKWSPIGGYGFLDHMLVKPYRFPKSPVTVLKIHGSASFAIGHDGYRPEASAVNFVFDEHFFPHSAKFTGFGYGERPYLIAPSFVKIPTVEITYLILDALTAAAMATNLVIIGCALRPEDGFLALILANFLRQDSGQARRVFIVDPNANEISCRLKNFRGVEISSQIVPLEGCLQDCVPSLLKALS
ncbi:MAG: hypothetical protein ACSLE2_04065 [Lysobacterales bacterium]